MVVAIIGLGEHTQQGKHTIEQEQEQFHRLFLAY